MDFKELKRYISENDKLPIILEALGMHSINGSNQKYYSCGFPDGDNPSSTIVYKDESLTVNAYTRNIKKDGDKSSNIFSLIMFINKCEFRTAITWCTAVLGLDNNSSSSSIRRTRINRRRDFNKKPKVNEEDIVYYDLDVLDKYSKEYHISLIQDDALIDTKILNKYKVMFDERTDRIIFPHLKYDDVTKVAGIVGRTVIKAYKELKINKYMSMLETKFDKTYNLYGLSLNIEEIKKHNMVCIFEAEKSVMKLDMFGMPIGVAVGCHDISEFQKKLLIRLGVDICICFDKDVDEEHIKKICSSLCKFRRVFYVKDDLNLLSEKDSPVDRGINVWNRLFKNKKEFKNEVKNDLRIIS